MFSLWISFNAPKYFWSFWKKHLNLHFVTWSWSKMSIVAAHILDCNPWWELCSVSNEWGLELGMMGQWIDVMIATLKIAISHCSLFSNVTASLNVVAEPELVSEAEWGTDFSERFKDPSEVNNTPIYRSYSSFLVLSDKDPILGLSRKFLFFKDKDLSVNVIKCLWSYNKTLMISTL